MSYIHETGSHIILWNIPKAMCCPFSVASLLPFSSPTWFTIGEYDESYQVDSECFDVKPMLLETYDSENKRGDHIKNCIEISSLIDPVRGDQC